MSQNVKRNDFWFLILRGTLSSVGPYDAFKQFTCGQPLRGPDTPPGMFSSSLDNPIQPGSATSGPRTKSGPPNMKSDP